MSPRVESLPILVLYPHSHCNCRCVMCDIWKEDRRRDMAADDFERCLADLRSLSVEWVVMSGGEPLMHSDLFGLCARVRALGIRVTVLSTGLLLHRCAAQIVEHVDDVIVSLDGPPEMHDRIRRVPQAFASLRRGVEAVHRLRPEFAIAGRSVVQRANFRMLRATARAAQEIGLCSISFLAADVTSTAFNRLPVWNAARQEEVALAAEDLPDLETEIAALVDEWKGDPFLADGAGKLQRIALHYRARLGLCEASAPPCNAPWVSAVVETDGAIRPCFFHPPIGHVRDGLAAALNGQQAISFRAQLDVATDPICRKCVCSLRR